MERLPLTSSLSLGSRLRWARYWASHEALRLPLVFTQRAAFKLLGRTTSDNAAEQAARVRIVQRRYRELLERDFQNAERGAYPKELLFDVPLGQYASELPRFLLDLPRTALRVRRRDFDELPRDVSRSAYPRYYLRNFHWQTDGYLSEHSAHLYDLSVEILFIGCADVMRRQVLASVHDLWQARSGSPSGKGLRLLDVASGTGRFLSQCRLALPEAELVGVDLSDYYVRFGRRKLEGAARLVAGTGEALPFSDESFDVITNIFLFHELPRAVRRRVLGEMFRVLAPGGSLVLMDAAQPFEAPELAFALESFPRDLHEPYFADYLRDDVAEAAREVGFVIDAVESHFVAKLVRARKPDSGSTARARVDA
jgi:ubiquinone/menaquinone biosynthesis C-methylase UbiE